MTPPGALFTDLYELTMAAGYFEKGIDDPAVFSLYARRHPRRGFFVAAGLEAALDFLSSFRFRKEDIAYLKSLKLFSEAFLDFLRSLRFDGEVRALPEGSLFFPDEPVMEIKASMIQAQILETYLINTIGIASMLATKAARCIHAARGRSLIDFSLRRTQGADAGMMMARSAYLAGFDATSNLEAGKRYGIPVAGTMAHSFVMAFEEEIDAFRAYARLFPERTILLIDTYDTLEGARKAVQIAKELQTEGRQLVGVRLDSGDLITLSRRVRQILDQGGQQAVKIFASGGYDEYRLAKAIEARTPIDAFGVGTRAGVSADAPYMDMVYKLVRFGRRNVRKHSTGKATLAGEKQVFRFADAGGVYKEDRLGLVDECPQGASALLQPVMRKGRRLEPAPDLEDLRRKFKNNFALLPDAYKQLENAAVYPVEISRRLQQAQP